MELPDFPEVKEDEAIGDDSDILMLCAMVITLSLFGYLFAAPILNPFLSISRLIQSSLLLSHGRE